jgi:hypothetical protein
MSFLIRRIRIHVPVKHHTHVHKNTIVKTVHVKVPIPIKVHHEKKYHKKKYYWSIRWSDLLIHWFGVSWLNDKMPNFLPLKFEVWKL